MKRACGCSKDQGSNGGGDVHESRVSKMRSATLSSSAGISPNELPENKSCAARDDSATKKVRLLFVADHEMDHAGRIGNPKAVEIFPELFHFIATRDAVDL